MLIDLHAHSHEISRCCRAEADEVLTVAKEAGLDGICLTNHYQKKYVREGGAPALAEHYIQEFDGAKQLGEAMGMRVLFGIELTLEKQAQAHVLIYGVAPDFVRENPLLFDLSLEELYPLVHQNGGVLVQAHPFRKEQPLLDVRFLDGVEINSHPLYRNIFLRETIAAACQNRLQLTSGGDFHKDTYRPFCGMELPESVTDGIALGKHLTSADQVTLWIQDVDAIPQRIEYSKSLGCVRIF